MIWSNIGVILYVQYIMHSPLVDSWPKWHSKSRSTKSLNLSLFLPLLWFYNVLSVIGKPKWNTVFHPDSVFCSRLHCGSACQKYFWHLPEVPQRPRKASHHFVDYNSHINNKLTIIINPTSSTTYSPILSWWQDCLRTWMATMVSCSLVG